MIRTSSAILAGGLLLSVGVAVAAAPVIVTQSGRRFSLKELTIPRGETIRFINADEFSHHVHVDGPGFSFDSGEQKPGQNAGVTFALSGTFAVTCEIHPKMLLKVTVN